ncbi:hypothetical protein Ahy_B09g098480 [Arachis hypogaea]|uniref:Aminotransferase-like plant mobile domain-containing protein n=1 Tax=Arachis hypogaea TaxID=3818 RepID=A0A444XRF5_ARAHY|nr:hypothetical protein Ahy_B09g098480 [Arachis hypogaea]
MPKLKGYLLHGECTIMLEDVAMIFGLWTHGFSVTESSDHITSSLEIEFINQFGNVPRPNDHRGSGIKLSWFRNLKRNLHLTNQVSKKIEKSGITVHSRYLPLLH